MKNLFMRLWLAVLAFFVWNGPDPLHVLAVQEPTQPGQTKPIIEHMTVIRKGVASIQVEESWFNPITGDARTDEMSYFNSVDAREKVTFRRELLVEHGTRRYAIKSVGAQLTGETWLNKVPVQYYDPYNSMFQSVAQRYKQSGWGLVGTFEFNGTGVTKVTFVDAPPQGSIGSTYTRIAYLDQATGLPVKEEFYIDNDSRPFAVHIYFFDRVNDPTGAIFKDFSGASIVEVASPSRTP